MSQLIQQIKSLLRDVSLFTQHASQLTLRNYQSAVAHAVVDSVLHRKGLSFVVCFPRQSGKNELQAQIEVYLMILLSQLDAEIVKVSPTWKPQSLNAMRRLQRVLDKNIFSRSSWLKESGYIFRFGSARIYFFSGQPEANIVGATASTLLEVDEAQDVLISKFDKDIAPMAASTNATRVFWGTAWTSRTLLARELRAALTAQQADGVQRAFILSADDVALEVPAYGQFVRGQIARLGRDHPMVKTQFFSEEIDAEGSMFNPARLALMQGAHPPLSAPVPGEIYAFLIDVAGEDEALASDLSAPSSDLANPARDATCLTIVRIDLSTLSDPLIQAPAYHAVSRFLWTGVKHTSLYAQIRSLSDTWLPRHLVIDATGVGAGLASFLDKALPGKVISFIFTSVAKSQLGWDFLAVVDSGRWKDYSILQGVTPATNSTSPPRGSPSAASGLPSPLLPSPVPAGEGPGSPCPEPHPEPVEGCRGVEGRRPELVEGSKGDTLSPEPAEPRACRGVEGCRPELVEGSKGDTLSPEPVEGSKGDLQSLFFLQLSFVQYEIQPGPEKRMKWSVPDGTRHPSTSAFVHDDLVLSAALSAHLDRLDWSISGPSLLVHRPDPLFDLDQGF